VEEVNHQNFGIKLFSEYVADPSAASFAEPEELQLALEKYPYCQLLHLFNLQTLVAKGSVEHNQHLAKTALLIPDRTILYTALNNPAKLNNTSSTLKEFIEIPESDERIEMDEISAQEDVVIINEVILDEETIVQEILEDESLEEKPQEEINSEEVLTLKTFDESNLTEEIQQQDEVIAEESIPEETASEEIQSEVIVAEENTEEVIVQTETSSDSSGLSEEEEINKEAQEATINEEQSIPPNAEAEIKDKSEWTANVEPQSAKESSVSKPVMNDSDLIENIFNQLIGAVPPPITPVAVYAVSTPFTDEDFLSETKDLTSADNRNLKKEQAPEIKEEIKVEEKAEIKVEQPLAKITDPQAEIQTKETVVSKNELVKESPIEPAKGKKMDQNVSKYDDDKMPYSFLWWLNKTRNEHADTYQPYVEFKLDTTQTIKRTSVDQLSSQIIENIFHLQSPLEEIENGPKTVPFQIRRKEDSILEKFIKEEPQIKPPSSQKLDTENKARKSAEDANDLVSETLAQIYIDQMLFQKAIDTFKKLSLKFPEKSTYFADQIIELEKKVN